MAVVSSEWASRVWGGVWGNDVTASALAAYAVLAAFGVNAHVWLPGIGYRNGIQLGNYLSSALDATGVDGAVGHVVDSYGGMNIGNSTAGQRPILRQNGSYMSWQFDGSDDRLTSGMSPFLISDDHCIVGAVRQDTATSGAVFFQGNTASTVQFAPYVGVVNDAGTMRARATWRSNSAALVVLNGAYTTGAKAVIAARRVGNTGYLRVDGNAGTAASGSLATLGAATVNVSAVGATVQTSITTLVNGHVYGVIAVKGTVSDASLLILERWIGELSGVSIS